MNELESAYIRPLSFYGAGSFGINPATIPVHTFMAAFYLGSYLGEEGIQKGISGDGLQLAPDLTHQLHPHRQGERPVSQLGAGQAGGGSGRLRRGNHAQRRWITLRGEWDEPVHGDAAVWCTPRRSSPGILEGITRNSVIDLLRGEGVDVREMELARGSLYDSRRGVSHRHRRRGDSDPGDRSTGGRSGEPGPVTRRAQELFSDAVAGKLSDYRDWLTFI